MIPVKIVAEISASHNGSLKRALAIVEAAARAGADAVKLQTFTPEQMAWPGTEITEGPWAGRNALDLYRQAHTPREWHKPLFARTRELGMMPFSSVFHRDDVDFLETLGCPMYKIASFEITDINLIHYAAATQKPIVISTGMASEVEITAAVAAAKSVLSRREITLLKCTSAYPAPLADLNLHTIPDMQDRYGVQVGFSDHTRGWIASVVATALGATMIEKHLTLDRFDDGLDNAFADDPREFSLLVRDCRRAFEALGEVRYGATPAEDAQLALRRRPGGKRGG